MRIPRLFADELLARPGVVVGPAARLPQVSNSAHLPLTLPYPPTVNTYWRQFRGRTIISKKGREYRAKVVELLRGIETLEGPLTVKIESHPPDRRRRDLDNILKALLDALQHAGAYGDDSQIKYLSIGLHPVCAGGKVVVSIKERV